MTRRIVYGIGLWVFLAATALSFTAIALPDWISFTSPVATTPSTRPGQPIYISYGLHRRCSSLTQGCAPFPQPEDCHGDDRYFCSMWRTVGFLMSVTVVMELATLVAFAVVLLGGRDKRESGWKMTGGMLAIAAVLQCAAMAMVAFLFDHDNRFFVGWKLDRSFILCTVSWAVLALDAAGIFAAAFFLEPEDDYEPISGRL